MGSGDAFVARRVGEQRHGGDRMALPAIVHHPGIRTAGPSSDDRRIASIMAYASGICC
jgi:hypothetical protein